MARCCGDTCLCRFTVVDDEQGNAPLVVTGTGSQADPFVLEFLGIESDNSTNDVVITVDFTSTGYQLSAEFALTSALDHIGDVNAPAPSNAQVLGWDSATSKWTARNPTTAASGSVTTDNSLDGDGSGGAPLAVAEDPDRFLDTFATGIGLTDAGINSTVRHFSDATTRASASPAPSLNSLSVLDDNPGQIDVWDGADWVPQRKVSGIDAPTAYLELSGAYDGRPVVVLVRQLSVVTDTLGAFIALSTADLTGYAGVLSVTIQPVGTVGWLSLLDPAPVGQVTGTAWGSDGGGPLESSAVTAIVTAYVY